MKNPIGILLEDLMLQIILNYKPSPIWEKPCQVRFANLFLDYALLKLNNPDFKIIDRPWVLEEMEELT